MSLDPLPAAADGSIPIVIGHRGASGYRPEHTIAAYQVAIQQGADFIEPDLVVTRDGVLIARHENALATVQLDADKNIVFATTGEPIVTQETTDVAEKPEFRNRLTVKFIDGVAIGGWFAEDFTLEEIKTLRARERIPSVRPRNTRFNDQLEIPTLREVIQLVKQVEGATGFKIGIYPETKHPTFFAKAGTYRNGQPIARSLGQILIDTLVATGFTDPSRVFIQSFEFENLIELKTTIMPLAGVDLPLVQLYGDVTNAFLQPNDNFSRPYDMRFNALRLTQDDLRAIYGGLYDLVPGGITATTGYGDLISPEVFQYLRTTYAAGIGPWKNSFLLRSSISPKVDCNGDGLAEVGAQLTGVIGPLLPNAQSAGLIIHPYTLRAEEPFLVLNADGTCQTVVDEAVQLLNLGVNGYFIDQPIDGVKGRTIFLSQ